MLPPPSFVAVVASEVAVGAGAGLFGAAAGATVGFGVGFFLGTGAAVISPTDPAVRAVGDTAATSDEEKLVAAKEALSEVASNAEDAWPDDASDCVTVKETLQV
mmetsp:Transcript_21126/g.35579  ORF Transcript_21126/g.35579 Transcript_21126/m.35579 type:complete len:104 (-) Transcript_21126:234-545(-)